MVWQLCEISVILGKRLSIIWNIQEATPEDINHSREGPLQQLQAQDRMPVNGGSTEWCRADSGSRDQANDLNGTR